MCVCTYVVRASIRVCGAFSNPANKQWLQCDIELVRSCTYAIAAPGTSVHGEVLATHGTGLDVKT